ncbi:MAG: septum formation initiator family protein [Synergistaceae bacterium]|nr:septum formation initiator family protein [Synergistaceae bacterium]MBQ4418163.1 septum formation initiator family protein [Synergistaceae bacterium]MBQ6739846.1 septum formation initiator family protein [Synergistaceae bacterium]MBQ9582344.1 septum formation initiator family protein [Synergistaceae bacterium]MBR0044330.1 septum formation initiator family protein [Synergistaceae bacterium]
MPPLRRILVWTVLILFLAIIFTYYAFEINNIFRLTEAKAEREAMLEEKRQLVESYKDKVEFYKTKEGIEHLAREQYNLVAPGERVILLVSPDE